MKASTRVIYEAGPYRIIEIQGNDFHIEDLKGDTYNPKWNTDISPETLRREELEFEEEVEREGVFGYELQHWNSAVGVGWEHVDSCWGLSANTTKHPRVTTTISLTK